MLIDTTLQLRTGANMGRSPTTSSEATFMLIYAHGTIVDASLRSSTTKVMVPTSIYLLNCIKIRQTAYYEISTSHVYFQ